MLMRLEWRHQSSTAEPKSSGTTVGATSDTSRIPWDRTDVRFSVYYNLQDDKNRRFTEAKADDGLKGLLYRTYNDPEVLQDRNVGATSMRALNKPVVHNLGDDGLSDNQIAVIAIDSLVTSKVGNWARKDMRLGTPMTALCKVKIPPQNSKRMMGRLELRDMQ
ncbi:hypothetical protein BO79DRAFT_217759 [Aspergillus costaricaensis CBS 115574]|uniref:Uncharacterized protein n=1 Tax=Aspergillus costaricaensis CBS 115574 TaxID=1448317 RepID=A0ACD1IH00_9EURO|nr:hypothetical protein BO79DRAFT_217759 [Aspergillus costaricaensis CBS 115574]RAK89053.1 hypothetical protein BO79DRAFT_217759 [Aspergillus costaricaensis CBS 115574]